MPTTTASLFADVERAPPDAILGVNADFRADLSPQKVNLVVGAYRTAEGEPYVLPLVRRVEQKILSDKSTNHEYLPQGGLPSFCNAAARLMLGNDSPVIRDCRVAAVQTLSGTGAVRLAFDFLATHVPSVQKVLIPTPTWPNHPSLAARAGLEASWYRYYDDSIKGINVRAILDDLTSAPRGSAVVLHACAHNPTGADPSREDWYAIRDVVKSRSLVPVFDCAYQGFATGNLEEDAFAVRLFLDSGIEMFVAQSFAKNMGLYGERVGALLAISASPDSVQATKSQLEKLARSTYSSPPLHGARIASAVLNSEQLMREWKTELVGMSERIAKMRTSLKDALVNNACPGNWDHIVNQIGMFSYTGLTKSQVRYMREKFHVYLTDNGRMSMAGLTEDSVEYVADAMAQAIKAVPKN